MLLDPHRSFAHAIGDTEEILQPPKGGDDHDEPPASWNHEPRSVHRAQVVASRGGGKEGEGINDVHPWPGCSSPGSFLCPLVAMTADRRPHGAATDLGNQGLEATF